MPARKRRAGWTIQSRDNVDLNAAQGIAIREFPLKKGHGFADYLLYVDGAAVGVIEAKRTGIPLTGVETQTAKYSVGLPDNLPAPPPPVLLRKHRRRNPLHQPPRTRRSQPPRLRFPQARHPRLVDLG